MCQVPTRRSKGLLLTCALAFIISSIPLAIVLFVYNPHIVNERAGSACMASELLPDVDERVAEVQAAADAQRDQLVEELGRFQRANRELRKQLSESRELAGSTKENVMLIESNDCERDLARATSGFQESYRRFEIVKGYFDKCKDQTTRLGKVLIDAEKEIKNLTKKLTTCNIINNKMEGEKRIAERKKSPRNTTIPPRM
mmetsp:Transcript_702/g.1162  ORF Transcript_702/g.1162 Transcript_702/m.1162 type:complete len:200 (+) Transcript_702:220-819(+)